MPKCAARRTTSSSRARGRPSPATPARGASSSAAKALAWTSRGSCVRPEIVAAESTGVSAVTAADVPELVRDREALALDGLARVDPDERPAAVAPQARPRCRRACGRRRPAARALLDELENAGDRRRVVEAEALARLARALGAEVRVVGRASTTKVGISARLFKCRTSAARSGAARSDCSIGCAARQPTSSSSSSRVRPSSSSSATAPALRSPRRAENAANSAR